MTLTDQPQPHTTTVDALPYAAPRLTIACCPAILTTFDGFTVSGLVHGSQVEGVDVEVSVAGVTRTGRVRAGMWEVTFEDGALSRHHAGVRAVTARVTDRWFNTAQGTEWVTVDEFEDGFVHVDVRADVTDVDGVRHLVATGELALGSHEEGRELVVVLVRDDAEAAVVSTGIVEPGWHHGEWRALLPLRGVVAGRYRVRAVLTDKVCASLTRLAAGVSLRLR